MAPARLATVLLLGLAALPARAADEAQLKRGEVLFQAADCVVCHTDVKGGGRPLAGGRPLTTPFGVFFSPNISPDWQTGIGSWSEAEFRRALRKGVGRHRQYLFPVFPYPAFTGMTDTDIGDLLAYLRTRTPVEQLNKPHQLRFPFGWRTLLFFWRQLFFRPGPLLPVAGRSAEWNRGRYLAEAVVHCQECHTPRNFLGGRETRPGVLRQSARSGRHEGAEHHRRRRNRHRQMERRRHRDLAQKRSDPGHGLRRLRHGRCGQGNRGAQRRRPPRHRRLHQVGAR